MNEMRLPFHIILTSALFGKFPTQFRLYFFGKNDKSQINRYRQSLEFNSRFLQLKRECLFQSFNIMAP